MEPVRDNLRFALDSFPEAGTEFEFVLSTSTLMPYLTVAAEGDPDGTPNLVTSLRGRLDLKLAGRRLIVKGQFSVKTEMICARCLSTFIGKVGDTVDEVVELGEPGGREAHEDPDGLVRVKDGVFDLAPLVAEFFWLSWPVRALCRPDCAGLCPGCGANLNDGPCLCRGATATRH
ncbi:MAG: DUF177 domain-containing protein [Deltaproteobacteria bacterium]|jgi:hypothetical protein|nr:DUF177 domain-containing protein [Deltaproteobacteria bacterium]